MDLNATSPRTILIGCAGASCSGKSTLTEWLAKVLQLPIIHQDKFFLADSQVPIVDGVQHWDCPGALDMDGFVAHLKDLKSAKGPAVSNLSPNRPVIAEGDIPSSELELLNSETESFRNTFASGKSKDVNIILVDGFLMMDSDAVLEQLDFVIFLHSEYSILKARREARFSYVTLEGTWQDPPNYFDQIVFPAYEEFNARILSRLTPGLSRETISLPTSVSESSANQSTVSVFSIDSGLVGISDMVKHSCNVILQEVSRRIK